MVKTIINGVVYDYIQPPITLGGGEHDHEAGELNLTDIEARIEANENQLANATADNVAGALVQRAEVTNFTDLVYRNADVNEVVELLQSSGYFYWQNAARNQFIQIGSSLLAEDPSTELSGITHYHEGTATVSIQGNDNMAPLRITAQNATVKNMFEVVDSTDQVQFAVKNDGGIESAIITDLLDRIADLENRLHIVENNAGLL